MTADPAPSLTTLAGDLRAEARRANERRVLVLAGEPGATRSAALAAVDAAGIDGAETTVVGPERLLDGERVDVRRAGELLGRTRSAVVVDAHGEFRPNALGAAVGAVDGGGLLLFLTPPLDDWPDRRDDFDAGIAVPPFDVGDVTGHFRRRLVDALRAHPGVAVAAVAVDGGATDDGATTEARGPTDALATTVERRGLTDPAPRLATGSPPLPDEFAFPAAAYGACLTDDQVDAVRAFESLREPGTGVVLEADRGRGKSSAAGLAAAALALDGRDVLVTAPAYRSCREVFVRARALLSDLGALAVPEVPAEGDQRPDPENRQPDPENPQLLRTAAGRIRYEPATAAVELPGDPDVVVVDEAAALPVRALAATLDAPAVAYATTVHGYEGAGRGFSVRFRDRLAESDRAVTEVSMLAPIRYAPADPVESWVFRALGLDARPAVDPLVADARPETVAYRRPTGADLAADEHLLREAFGLLVLAHYRTEPDDLARLLDAPNVTVRALSLDGHVAAVALLAREGDLPADRRDEMYDGARIGGNMIPDVLTTQLRDRDAGRPVGQRVLRIATHPAVRSRGLGSHLLSRIREEYEDEVDWLGVGYGATPELVSFWRANGYRTVHCATTRNDASGEYSAIMLDPCSADGRALAAEHGEWFRERVGSVLSDPLDDLDADVARAVLGATDEPATLALSARERRLLAGVPAGASTFDTAPGPFRRLALRHLTGSADGEEAGADVDVNDADVNDAGVDHADVDDADGPLTDREERLLVRKVLQGHPWDDVAAALGYVSTAECMRSLGGVVETLLDRYVAEPSADGEEPSADGNAADGNAADGGR